MLNNYKIISLYENNEKDYFTLKKKYSHYYYFCKLVVIFLIITNIKFSYEIKKLIDKQKRIEAIYNEPEIKEHSLYNLFKYPQISLLITSLEKFPIYDLLNFFLNQSFKDIQFILYLSSQENKTHFNILKEHLIKDNKNIEIYVYKGKPKLIDKIYYLTNKIKGKYTIFLNEYIKFKKKDLDNIYNFTKGKINNIFKFIINNKNSIFLIKTKILKDLNDNKIIAKSYDELINYIFLMKNPNLNYIHISYCLNNHYTPLVYVSMISILSYKHYYTFISFYLIISQNFEKKNIDLLTSLYQQYDFFNITFIKIDKKYENSFVSRHITKEAYYRFSLGELLPFLNKIIYLDGDTIIFRDLTKFYNLNFNGKIILGQVTGNNKSKKDHIYKINSGILLLNLKKMREIKMEKLTINILNKGEKLYYHDQTLINQYFHKYVGIYPPEFHSRKFNDYLRVKKWNKISGNLYDNDYLYFSWKYPTIRHYLGRSKYKNNNFVKNYDWFYFARKSKYFKKKTNNINEIFNY